MAATDTFHASLFDAAPDPAPDLDPGFRPWALGARRFRAALTASPRREPVVLGLAQGDRPVARLELEVFPEGAGRDRENLRYVTAHLDGLLWARGGSRVRVAAPPRLREALLASFGPDGDWAFERELLGRAYDEPLAAEAAQAGDIPPEAPCGSILGGHLDGCRIGFDLGASDYKVAAVMDGREVFSAELPWEPKGAADPAYHVERIDAGLRLAAAHLPRVDAIGGSSAGILVGNRVKVASLFRGVPEAVFRTRVEPLFLRLGRAWGVPFEVINDGDVTALAGGLSLGVRGLLGIALGSSEAAGYLDREGRITGWLNELAFGSVDAAPGAAADDWSGDPGAGAACFSQQAVDRLAAAAGLPFEPGLDLPGRLREAQVRLGAGDPRALRLFRTIGHWLGHTLPWYAAFYPLDHVLILGRVTSGDAGPVILEAARAALARTDPALAGTLALHLPDEKSRRVGQAVAAASLPRLAGG
ncbi:hypothetical protein [Mesoterricola sediminis]|uniref:ROK family protein n=1 Tax=Mesoterricola sediminis TaxID=2927980 RepID=A0AA48GXG4_9BACT|nr:hypothetical protein [Mesoterricola sediminis]BDU78074.1 hypothetical protein METESE_30320 [Mesoterricola sediminis]